VTGDCNGKVLSSHLLVIDGSNFLQGFTFDTVLRLFKKTALNPAISVPLWLCSIFSVKGKELATLRPITAKWIKAFAIWAITDRIIRFLDKRVLNNWTNDTYDWSHEIVVVTGGSDGIGACIVKLLSELKIKVVILDIQQPKFNRKFQRGQIPKLIEL
jgi:all-trans-retinol dehydrogenase (NAD+)